MNSVLTVLLKICFNPWRWSISPVVSVLCTLCNTENMFQSLGLANLTCGQCTLYQLTVYPITYDVILLFFFIVPYIGYAPKSYQGLQRRQRVVCGADTGVSASRVELSFSIVPCWVDLVYVNTS